MADLQSNQDPWSSFHSGTGRHAPRCARSAERPHWTHHRREL